MTEQVPRPGKNVCAACLEDGGLMRFAYEHRRVATCDFCGATNSTTDVAALDDVIREMKRYVSREWIRVADDNSPPLDFDGFLNRCHDSKCLFKKIDFSVSNPVLMAELVRAFGADDWCRKRLPASSPSTKWADGWEAFKSYVMYRRRYTFWQADTATKTEPRRHEPAPSRVLYEIKTLLNKSKLVRTVKPGTVVWRAAILSENETPKVPERFTSPPPRFALTPNRMSPAGIPMFYGADDFETACRELDNPYDTRLKGKVAMAVQFRNMCRLNVLDLTMIPTRRSYFAPVEPGHHYVMDFLREFAEDLSIPIKKGSRLQIDYVPTQVFTEFVRFMMKGPKGVPIHGIRYSSSRTGRPCWVIFATHTECLPQAEMQVTGGRGKKRQQLLDYVNGSVKRVDLPWTKAKVHSPADS